MVNGKWRVVEGCPYHCRLLTTDFYLASLINNGSIYDRVQNLRLEKLS